VARGRYEQHRPGWGTVFEAEFDRAVARIRTTPQAGPSFRGRFRWVRLRRFPYLIYYLIIDPHRVRVLAVAHARRRPGYWIRRLGNQ
jgi:toxin ParE1/3/4